MSSPRVCAHERDKNRTPINRVLISLSSDASSEHLGAVDRTDSEGAGGNGFIVGHNPVAVMRGSYAGLSPMIIMNNFVLKQVKYARLRCICVHCCSTIIYLILSYLLQKLFCTMTYCNISLSSSHPRCPPQKNIGAFLHPWTFSPSHRWFSSKPWYQIVAAAPRAPVLKVPPNPKATFPSLSRIPKSPHTNQTCPLRGRDPPR